MTEAIISVLIGIALVIMGIFNTKGSIWAIHSYHRANIPEEDKLPFGKIVGVANIIMGIALFLFGVFSIVEIITKNEIYSTIGFIILTVGLVIGIIISFYAIKKYNKKIF